jgi:hypothetical protein
VEPRTLQKGEVVQISPEYPDPCFGGCFLVVTEPKSFGAMGYISGVGQTKDEPGGIYWLRVKYEWIEPLEIVIDPEQEIVVSSPVWVQEAVIRDDDD